MRRLASLLAACIFTGSAIGQTGKDADIHHMLSGNIYAYSPKKNSGNTSLSETGLFLKIDTTKTILIDGEYNGYRLYLGNNTDSTVELPVIDGLLYAVAEIYYKGDWKPIEYIPSSWCGNSYYTVSLTQKTYWSFEVFKFTGKIKTRLRYRLFLNNNHSIYSNEIPASINRKQLTSIKKQEATEGSD